LKTARYIPPEPFDMKEALSDLEEYINSGGGLDVLIRAALIHYQFETIHPFLDGNGRTGRLLITLFLMEKGALTRPALYISYFLKKNRIEYYDHLALHEKNTAVLRGAGRGAKTALRLFAYLEEHPIIDIQKTAADLKAAFNTVSDAVRRLCDMGILTQAAGTSRNRTFAYQDYLEILRKGT
jgi:Fic family protein